MSRMLDKLYSCLTRRSTCFFPSLYWRVPCFDRH